MRKRSRFMTNPKDVVGTLSNCLCGRCHAHAKCEGVEDNVRLSKWGGDLPVGDLQAAGRDIYPPAMCRQLAEAAVAAIAEQQTSQRRTAVTATSNPKPGDLQS